MKLTFNLFIFLFVLNTNLVFAKNASKKMIELASELNINLNEKGKCLFNRNELNSVQLNAIFKIPARRSVSELEPKDLNNYWNCIYIRRNFRRDNKKDFISYDRFESLPQLNEDKAVFVEGKIKYLGLVNKKYKYDLLLEDNILTAHVRIHFDLAKNLDSPFTIPTMKEKVRMAETKWNEQTLEGFKFKFEVVNKKENAHYSVKLLNKPTRGPYDIRWSYFWGPNTIAHEFGHMLGLDDEYDNLFLSTLAKPGQYLISSRNRRYLEADQHKLYSRLKNKRCDLRSFMCSNKGYIKKWHLYVIFKRFYQK